MLHNRPKAFESLQTKRKKRSKPGKRLKIQPGQEECLLWWGSTLTSTQQKLSEGFELMSSRVKGQQFSVTGPEPLLDCFNNAGSGWDSCLVSFPRRLSPREWVCDTYVKQACYTIAVCSEAVRLFACSLHVGRLQRRVSGIVLCLWCKYMWADTQSCSKHAQGVSFLLSSTSFPDLLTFPSHHVDPFLSCLSFWPPFALFFLPNEGPAVHQPTFLLVFLSVIPFWLFSAYSPTSSLDNSLISPSLLDLLVCCQNVKIHFFLK